MSSESTSSAQGAPSKDGPDDKSKTTPGADKPATQPDKAPTEVSPPSKS